MGKSLREEMPQTAAFIDAMREAFGAEEVDTAIRAGLQGQSTFYAKENGREIGSRLQGTAVEVLPSLSALSGSKARRKKGAA